MAGMAWQVRMRIIEAYLAAITDQPKREFLPHRTPVTGKRDSRVEHVIKGNWGRRYW